MSNIVFTLPVVIVTFPRVVGLLQVELVPQSCQLTTGFAAHVRVAPSNDTSPLTKVSFVAALKQLNMDDVEGNADNTPVENAMIQLRLASRELESVPELILAAFVVSVEHDATPLERSAQAA